MTMNESRYAEALKSIPAPGNGCHPALLGVANLGILAGRDPQELMAEIQRSIPEGSRRVPDREISAAISKAAHDLRGQNFAPRPRNPEPAVKGGPAVLRRIIEQGKFSGDADLWEESPIKIKCLPEETPALFLSTVFADDDLIFIGERRQAGILGKTIRSTAEWIDFLARGGRPGPFFIINPLSGKPEPRKSEPGATLRGDGCVKFFKHALAEFDQISVESQIRFWSAARLPIKSLTFSGGKSIHAILDVQKIAKVSTQDQWRDEIKQNLYSRILAPLGVDSACSNPARLSRVPGHFRKEKSAMQRLLWLSREGRPIC